MTSDLKDFFSAIGKAKKEKENEVRSLVGDIDIDSMFSQVKISLEEDKKKKETQKKQIAALESWLYAEVEEKKEEIIEASTPIVLPYEEVEIEEEEVVEEVEEVVEVVEEEEEIVEEQELDDTVDHALKILETIKSKEEVRENVSDPEIVKIRGELEYLKNLVNAQGGGGEVRLEFLDDVDRDSVKVEGQVLAWNQTTGKFIGTTVDVDIVGYAHTAGISTVSQGLTGTPDIVVGIVTATSLSVDNISISGNVSIGGTLTYEDVTNVDSIGIITARSGIEIGGPVILNLNTSTSTTTSTSQDSVDTFSVTDYRSASYQIQITRGTEYHVTSLNIVHDGTDVYVSEFGTINTGAILATFTADIDSGNVRILATPTSATSTVFKMYRNLIRA